MMSYDAAYSSSTVTSSPARARPISKSSAMTGRALARPAMRSSVVAFEIACHAHRDGSAALPEMPSALLPTLQVEGEAIVMLEIVERARCRGARDTQAPRTTRRFAAILIATKLGSIAPPMRRPCRNRDAPDQRLSVSPNDTRTSGFWATNDGPCGATCLRPNAAGAETTRWPVAFCRPSES